MAAGLPRRRPDSDYRRQPERDEAMRPEQERSLRGGLERIRRDMLAGQDDALARVELERRMELEARRGFSQAVAEARAEGFTWEHIAGRVPWLARHGAEAAEMLFELVAVPGAGANVDHLSWRCGDCDGTVLDRGPYGGHPVDAEPGHRDTCGRLAAEASRYVAGLGADHQLAAGIAREVTGHVRGRQPATRPVEFDGRGLELW